MMTWTEQKIQMLKDMWGHHSASEIAEHIGGLTRMPLSARRIA